MSNFDIMLLNMLFF